MKVVPLAVAGAFHTAIMDPAVDRLRSALHDAEMKEPTIPVYSNVDAAPHQDPGEIRDLLIQQVVAARAVGDVDSGHESGRLRPVLRGGAGSRAAGIVAAHRPKDVLRRRRLLALLRSSKASMQRVRPFLSISRHARS